VPLEYVSAIGGTNGVAAGNRIEEAIAQAAFEVFERRAVITVVKNRMTVPTFALDSIESPALRAQIAALRGRGTELVVKDLSFGGVLPCVGVYFLNRGVAGDLQAHHALKAAASFDREAALMNCLTEYAQICEQEAGEGEAGAYRRLVCSNDTDNFLPLFWFGYVPFAEAAFLIEGEMAPFDRGAAPADCLEDIERIKSICAQLDKDCVVVDLTDPAVGFPVVQVIIPGYSDILPYHPPSSPVLLKGWTRDLSMGECRTAEGLRPCTAAGLFPGW
jgi:ribosomal protein S12 methylthiotransferase accessory factor YcaO